MRAERLHLSIAAAIAGLACLTAPAFAQNGGSAPLARLQFDIVGIRLVVDPPVLTVPKNVPTLINTSLVVPPSAGADVRDALSSLTAGALVEAELRGPSLPATRITAPPGQPLPIPALALAGDYFLDAIRLTRNGQILLDATAPDGRPATTIPIRVINEVFVTNVTSRPLSLEEIRERGIVIDQTSFQAVNFQVAFNIDGQPFTIDMPSVLPTPQLLQTTADRTSVIRQVAAMNQALAATQTRLPAQFDRPGINFSIAALPFVFVPEDGDVPSLDIPPVNGLVVIAGNVAFLHQFFKVAVMVANVAPDGSLLNLRDVTGRVTLPRGLDGIAGTTESPGDDPLRLARLDGLGVRPDTRIVRSGPDGAIGTADDIATIAPQQQGEGELLLEGLKEGGHTFDVGIEATLDGLPSGPIRMTGVAAGAVFVRNPTFAVTLAHPRTIRSGETYDLYATVTNTSRSVANLVSINLDPLSISGAQLLSNASVAFDSLPAGESATARFTLRAQRTGEVTFSSFTGEASTGGGIKLSTGIGERDIPLAPNSIVLPGATNALPQTLVAAAQRVLGQAFSIASAPPEAIPSDVRFIRRQTVIDRGIELAQAGERIEFGESPARVMQDLLLDWMGNDRFDDGFDELIRTTQAGAAFLSELAAAIAPAAAPDVLGYQRDFAGAAASRPVPHVSAFAAAPGLPAPDIRIVRADGTEVRAGAPGAVTMPAGAVLQLSTTTGTATASVVGITEPVRHVFEFTARSTGVHDFGIVVPGATPGSVRHLRYAGITLTGGGIARVELDLGAFAPAVLQIDADGNGEIDSTASPALEQRDAGAPTVLNVRQLETSFRDRPGNPLDPATYGLLVGVLFDKPVTTASAELRTNYSIEGNEVAGARLQPGGRLVYLYLRQPVGALTPRSLTVTGVQDATGNTMSTVTRPIASTLTEGGRVFGQVREAGGQPVPNAVLRLTVVTDSERSFDVAAIRVDQNGSFDFDFVPRAGLHFVLTAQHPVTRDLTTVVARVRGTGEQLLLNPTFTGRGRVRGRLLATDGVTPLANVPVALIPGAVLGNRGYQVRSDQLGAFTFTDVPVGIFTLSASDGARGFAQAQGVISRAGDDVVHDLVLVEQPASGGHLGGRVFLADGSTPARAFTVYIGSFDRQSGSVRAVDATTTDDAGSFSFDRTLPPDSYDVVAVDPGSQQIGATSAAVTANLTTSVSIVLEANGAVEGVVFNAQGQPVAGAVVAGGAALVTADGNGFFRIDGVPAGSRTIEAGDPVTRRRGSARVTVTPGQTARLSIRLEARATITGRVLDANGNPMPRVSVRLPVVGGYSFVFTNSQGVYTFPDLTLGSHLIQAPGPSVDSLITFLEANGYDPAASFTSGDGPPGSAPPPSASDRNAVLAAYERAVQSFFSVDESILGLPMASIGGFGWTKVDLLQDSTTVVADLRFLPQGEIAGRTEDASGRATGAVVRVTGLAVSNTGSPTIAELGRRHSDAASGAFSFSGIPRFDLVTFQRAGVRGGDFTVEAANPFSPAIVSHRGQLNPSTPNLANIVLRFPSASETNGTVSGQVLLPDSTPAPANTQVRISFGDLTVLTGPDGRFTSLLPIPAGTYTLTATVPGGLRGQSTAAVPAGGNAEVVVRVLGVGGANVIVRRANGTPVANADVRLERGTFPHDRADGRTNGDGAVTFVNITEGPVSIVAEENSTGLSGRASGTVVRGGDVTIPIVIQPSGTVRGTFLAADGATPIPAAQITITSGAVQGFTSTDGAGRFELHAVPVGAITVDASDPLSGRTGRTTSQLSFEGQVVDVTVLQLPRGSVAGVVLNADGVTPVGAARVRIRGSGVSRLDLQATARSDGRFRFEAVPQGTFTIEATDPVSGFHGSSTGRIEFEGEAVDSNVTLEPFGALDVVVHDHTGAPAGNATVSLSGPGGGRTAVVAADGTVSFEHLRLGTYRLTARSLADPGSGGEQEATIAAANQRTPSTVTLRGSGVVTLTVVAADGVTPAPSAQVTLDASAALGLGSAGAAASTFNGFTDSAGTVTFTNVPVGNVFARAEAGAVAGVISGAVTTPGESVPLAIRLGASGRIEGRVLLPDGITPAARAIVTVLFQSQSQLQTGALQVTTGIDGTFAFSGIPVGTFTLGALEVVTSGVRNAGGTITSNGQLVLIDDLILDNASPRIVEIDPADRTAGVPADAAFRVTFSEPLAASTIRIGDVAGANVALMQGASRVPLAAPSYENGNRTLVVRPLQPLPSASTIALTIAGGPDAPQDEAGFTLLESFTATFTVRDLTPPAIVSTSPSTASREVTPDASVRVTFSEPVSVANLTLTTSTGAVVPGTRALTAGNTVLVFVPQALLQPNTAYVATISGVTDGAGNAMAGGASTIGFSTIDTLAPIISSLQIGGVARAGGSVSVQALVAATDLARVEFRTSSGFSAVAGSPPFAVTVPLPADASSTTISAVAFDESGNRSNPFEQSITIQSDAPPTVTLTNVTEGSDVRQGATLTFEVRGTDDTALSRLLFSAVGAATVSTIRPVPGTPSSFTSTFTVPIPLAAPSGQTVVVQAASVDSLGQQSAPVSLSFTVVDGIRPSVTILAPVDQAQVLPGQPLTVVMDANDDVGVASVTLVCNPSLSGCEHRSLAASLSTRQTFTLDLPATLQAPAVVTLIARATDAAGNSLEVGRTVRLVDGIAPVVASVAKVSGSTHVLAGEQVALRASVSDNVGVTSLVYSVSGALVAGGEVAVAPPLTSGFVPFGFTVPASASNGESIAVNVRARDAAGNLGAEAVLLLTVGDTAAPVVEVVAPVPPAQTNPGTRVTLRVRTTDDVGVARVAFAASGAVTVSGQTQPTSPATVFETAFDVDVPPTADAGPFTLTAQAFDTAGNPSTVVSLVVQVNDVRAPTVQIVSPAPGAAVDPRAGLSVVVSASDQVGVTGVSLSVSGTATATESRTLPAASATQQTFAVPLTPAPPRGGALTITASVRDAAGNTGTASVTVQVSDVVAPTVVAFTPADGAAGVDRTVSPAIRFSEPMNPASLSAALHVRRDGAAVPVMVTVDTAGEVATLSPATPLAPNTLYTVVVTTAATDANGNAVEIERTAEFRTASNDVDRPQIASVTPADGAANVALTAPVDVTFTEAIDPATVTPASFSVHIGGQPVTGVRSMLNANRSMRFQPAEPWAAGAEVVVELHPSIADLAGNTLADAAGAPLSAPATSAFTTTTFGISSPTGGSVVEHSHIVLEARAANAADIASVVFTVNEVAQPAAPSPGFSRPFVVPAATSTATLVVRASARNTQGVEVASDVRTFAVVVGLRVAPTLAGIPVGGTVGLRFTVSSALDADLPIQLRAGNASLVSFPVNPVVLPAGMTEVTAQVAGLTTGNTAIFGESERGTATAVVSVSPRVDGQTLMPFAPSAGVSISNPPSAGLVVVAPAASQTARLRVLTEATAADVPVTITSTNAAVATATAGPVPAGQLTADLVITTGADGIATLIVRAGDVVRSVTVIVGTPPAGSLPLVLAAPAGVAISNPPNAGQVVVPSGSASTFSVVVLNSPAQAATVVTVDSTNPAIATATASTIQPGGVSTALSLSTSGDGVVTLIIRAGTEVRAVTVFVGNPPIGQRPILLAPPVGVSISNPPSIAQLVSAVGADSIVELVLLGSPASAPTSVSVTSSDPAVATATADAIEIGSRSTTLRLVAGSDGIATLTMRVGSDVRTVTVFVGNVPPDRRPVLVAPPVGASIAALPYAGSVVAAPGAPLVAPLDVQLLTAARTDPVDVTVHTSDPAIATVNGGPSARAELSAGRLVLGVTIATTGSEGTAVLTFEFGGERRQLLVVVGNPPASQRPAVVAPVIGVRIGG